MTLGQINAPSPRGHDEIRDPQRVQPKQRDLACGCTWRRNIGRNGRPNNRVHGRILTQRSTRQISASVRVHSVRRSKDLFASERFVRGEIALSAEVATSTSPPQCAAAQASQDQQSSLCRRGYRCPCSPRNRICHQPTGLDDQRRGSSNGSYSEGISTPSISQIRVTAIRRRHSVWLRHECVRRTRTPDLERWNWV